MAKNNRYKTYPFPYLADYSSDYKKTKFTLEVNHKTEQGNIVIQIAYQITNDQIIDLIKSGVIQVVVKIVCPTMGFSRVLPISSSANTIKCSYSTMRFDDDVELKAFLVAKKSFVLANDDLSEDWKNDKTIIMANNIIGESNERVITINHLKSGSAKSIFQFAVSTSKDEASPFSYSLTDKTCIVFRVSAKTMNIVADLRKKDDGKQFIYSAFIIPVIADILRQMINTEFDEDGEIIVNDFNISHSSKKWYMVLCDNYSKAFDGKDPTEKGGIPPLEAAQQLIDRYAEFNTLVRARKYIRDKEKK